MYKENVGKLVSQISVQKRSVCFKYVIPIAKPLLFVNSALCYIKKYCISVAYLFLVKVL